MSQKQAPPVLIRHFTDEDIGFVFNSWLKSYRNSLFARTVSSSIYFSEHHKVLEQIAKKGTILLAVNPEDVSQIYGYIAASRIDGILVIHYVYVKHPYRRFGIAKTLLNQFEHDPGAAACYTHHTKVIERVAPRYNMIYHPYILINHMQEGEDEVAEEAVSES